MALQLQGYQKPLFDVRLVTIHRHLTHLCSRHTALQSRNNMNIVMNPFTQRVLKAMILKVSPSLFLFRHHLLF
jgi:hypothetical protein